MADTERASGTVSSAATKSEGSSNSPSVNGLHAGGDSTPVLPPGNKAKVFAAVLGGVCTDFAILEYSNRTFISVSQCGRIGNLYLVQRSTQLAQYPAVTASTIYDVRCVLGGEDQATCVAVRSLAEKLQLNKPLLVSLTLPAPTPAVLTSIAALIAQADRD